MSESTRRTVPIDDETWSAVRRLAAQRSESVRDVVCAALRSYVQQCEKSASDDEDAAWAKRIQNVSASIPYVELDDEQLADALGAAQFLYELLRGESITRERKAS